MSECADMRICKCANDFNFYVIAMNGLWGEEATACYTEPHADGQ
jgi:hypothetical protein